MNGTTIRIRDWLEIQTDQMLPYVRTISSTPWSVKSASFLVPKPTERASLLIVSHKVIPILPITLSERAAVPPDQRTKFPRHLFYEMMN